MGGGEGRACGRGDEVLFFFGLLYGDWVTLWGLGYFMGIGLLYGDGVPVNMRSSEEFHLG